MQKFTWEVKIPNLVDPPSDIVREVTMVDGHTLLQVDHYSNHAQTIDLRHNSTVLTFTDPLFKDDSQDGISLLNPTLPERNLYFKIVGHDTTEVSSLVTVTLLDNTQVGTIEV